MQPISDPISLDSSPTKDPILDTLLKLLQFVVDHDSSTNCFNAKYWQLYLIKHKDIMIDENTTDIEPMLTQGDGQVAWLVLKGHSIARSLKKLSLMDYSTILMDAQIIIAQNKLVSPCDF